MRFSVEKALASGRLNEEGKRFAREYLQGVSPGRVALTGAGLAAALSLSSEENKGHQEPAGRCSLAKSRRGVSEQADAEATTQPVLEARLTI